MLADVQGNRRRHARPDAQALIILIDHHAAFAKAQATVASQQPAGRWRHRHEANGLAVDAAVTVVQTRDVGGGVGADLAVQVVQWGK